MSATCATQHTAKARKLNDSSTQTCDVELSTDEAAFASWAAEQGISSSFLSVRRGKFGLGLFARQDIPENTAFASLPLKYVLTEECALQSAVGRAVSEQLDRITAQPADSRAAEAGVVVDSFLRGQLVLFAFMMQQRFSKDGLWGPYLRAVPQQFSMPFWWSPQQLALLQGTNMGQAVPHQKRYWNEVFALVFQPLLAADSAEQPLFPPHQFNIDSLLWAYGVYTSRGFPARVAKPAVSNSALSTRAAGSSGRDSKRVVGCLLPYLDLMNHKRAVKIDWITGVCPTPNRSHDSRSVSVPGPSVDSQASTSSVEQHRVWFVLRDKVSKGSEVFNNYGAKGNEEWVMGYGFAVPDNPDDTLKLQVAVGHQESKGTHTSGSSFDDKALNLLRAAGSSGVMQADCVSRLGLSFGFYLHRRGGVPPALMSLLRVLSLREPCKLPLLSSSALCPYTDKYLRSLLDDVVSYSNEFATISILAQVLSDHLRRLYAHRLAETPALTVADGYSADRQQLEQLLSQGRHASPEAMAVAYRLGQHDVLDSSFVWVQQRRRTLEAQRDEWLASPHSCCPPPQPQEQKQEQRQQQQQQSQQALATQPLVTYTCDSVAFVPDVGVVSQSAVATDDPLMAIPRSHLIDAGTAGAHASFAQCLAFVDGLQEEFVIMLFLLHLRHILPAPSPETHDSDTAETTWSRFIGLCQERLGVCGWQQPPLLWSSEALAMLPTPLGDTVRLTVQARLKELRDVYDQMFPALTSAAPAHFPAEAFAWDRFKWAAAVLDAYGVELGVVRDGAQVGTVLAVLPWPFVPAPCSAASAAFELKQTATGAIMACLAAGSPIEKGHAVHAAYAPRVFHPPDDTAADATGADQWVGAVGGEYSLDQTLLRWGWCGVPASPAAKTSAESPSGDTCGRCQHSDDTIVLPLEWIVRSVRSPSFQAACPFVASKPGRSHMQLLQQLGLESPYHLLCTRALVQSTVDVIAVLCLRKRAVKTLLASTTKALPDEIAQVEAQTNALKALDCLLTDLQGTTTLEAKSTSAGLASSAVQLDDVQAPASLLDFLSWKTRSLRSIRRLVKVRLDGMDFATQQ